MNHRFNDMKKGDVEMPRKKMELNVTRNETAGTDRELMEVTCISKDIPLICDRIRYYRQKKELEQKQLADSLGIKASAVSNWETGRSRPDVNLLPEICRILEISLYQLFLMEDTCKHYTAEEQALMQQYRGLSVHDQHVVKKLVCYLREDDADADVTHNE